MLTRGRLRKWSKGAKECKGCPKEAENEGLRRCQEKSMKFKPVALVESTSTSDSCA